MPRRRPIRAGGDAENLPVPSWTGGGTDYGGCYGRFDAFDDDVTSGRPFMNQTGGANAGLVKAEGVFAPNVGFALAAIRDGVTKKIGTPGPASRSYCTRRDRSWSESGAVFRLATQAAVSPPA